GNQKIQPTTTGTSSTHGALLVGVLNGSALLVGALTFIPVRAAGPVAEHLSIRRLCGDSFMSRKQLPLLEPNLVRQALMDAVKK
ncbi:potassium-transporting ATPase subunit KdpA, partial [Enterobacter hormaechei]|uniref:potassium-transporting ATPase subunit KdpA n=1 Tax=Enterobacter hormaechei TaxID=158836 RepID=UPI001921835F